MIEFAGVHFTYPGCRQETLIDLSLSVEKGGLLGLIGPNGAGKTTMISLLTGRFSASKGSVRIAGYALPSERNKIKGRIGYIPQDYAFYPQLTLMENMEFFAGVQKLPRANKKARIQACMEFCQIAHMAGKKVQTFSGGLKRRTNIAIGLLADPEILLFDEPTVGIDPQSRAFILKQIKALQEEGKTIVYTSHYMEEVEQLCDVLAIIDHGRILQQGTIHEVHAHLDSGLEIEFCADADVSGLRTLADNFDGQLNGSVFSSESIRSEDDFSRFMQEALNRGLKIKRLSYGQSRLEQLFLQMTDRELRD